MKSDTNSTTDRTTIETRSTTSSEVSNDIRKSNRPSMKPNRLTYDRLGFFNLSNVWNQDTLLAITDFVDYAMRTVTNTPRTYHEAVNGDNKNILLDAINSELNSLQSLNTWTVIDSSTVNPHNILSSNGYLR